MSDMIFPGTATPAQVLANQTFSAGTNYGATGTMPNNGALGTITPGTAAHAIPAGYTSGGTVAGDPNLVAANLLNDVSIFGVVGSFVPRYFASGSGTVPSTGSQAITVSGLGFTPLCIVVNFVWYNGTTINARVVYNNDSDGESCNNYTYAGSSNLNYANGNWTVNNGSFSYPFSNNNAKAGSTFKWYAFG